jgi:THO complex subunit 3
MKIPTLGSNLNMSWSPDGNYLAVGNKSDQLLVLDVRTGNQIRRRKFPYEVNELAWTFNSNFLLAATAGRGAGAVDLIALGEAELEVVQTFVAHSATCFNLTVDPLFSRVAVSSVDCCVSLWDLRDLVCIKTLTLEYVSSIDCLFARCLHY